MDLKKSLENKLEEIANFLLNHKDYNIEIGALTGISGNALFHFYYANYKDDDRHREKGAEIISKVFSRIEQGYTYPTFCDGIAGACWVLELLKEEKFIELEEDIITEDLDEYLFNKMKGFITNNNFDFLHDAIGIGYYFLKRYENIQISSLRNRYEKYLLELLNAISQNAIKERNIVKWKSEIRSGDFKAEGYNLGLAHGIPSTMFFLSKLTQHLIFFEQCFKLLEPACKYILSCQYTDKSLTSSFPNWIVENQPTYYKSRLAWCYGDLCMGIALLQTAKMIRNETFYQKAIDLLLKTTKRKDSVEVGIKDLGLCHGTFSIINMYKQIYQISNNNNFKDSMDFWLKSSLDSLSPSLEKINFGEEKMDLLNGLSGIGLTILSYLNNDLTNWKEALLIK
ncbi:lanthionine synthetase C family protein [uncultured Aquimarina sp.]|uniref:lanthionine synthetase C family protein n=1 Tax=uncultured Aquimarina sp. TaxID=575652 RepID=UPI0026089044|nr:lanthionine synthetase C family protein [uncultured Aquimarina sp.]